MSPRVDGGRSCLLFFHEASKRKHFPLLTCASHPWVSGHRGLPSPSGQACPRPLPRFLPFYITFCRTCLCIMLFPKFPATSLGHIPKSAISGPKGKSLCKGCLWHRFQVSTFFLKPFSFFSSHCFNSKHSRAYSVPGPAPCAFMCRLTHPCDNPVSRHCHYVHFADGDPEAQSG